MRRTACCLPLLLLVGSVSLSSQTTTAVPCNGKVYRGFDSRLTGELLARIPEATKDFVGLEVDGKQVFVAARDAVYAVDAGKVAVTRSDEPLQGIAMDRQGDLLVQSRQTIRIIPRSPGKPFSAPGESITGRIVASGADSFLEIRDEADNRTRLIAHRASDFAPFQLATLQGVRGPIAWTPTGMAAILDSGVMVMALKDSSLVGVDRDRAFGDATGITQLPDGRIIVALKNLLLITGKEGRLVLAAIHGAVRPAGSSAIVFDRSSGYLWQVSGLDKVGNTAADRRHADDLLSRWKKSGDVQSGLEAARILGCQVLSVGR